MRIILPSIFLFACIIIVSSCGAGRMTNASSSGTNKRTVTIKTHNANQLSGEEAAIASAFLSNEKKYFPKYVEINYESVNKRFDSLYSNLNYWNKTKLSFSRKRQYRLYADATGTDHLLDLDVHITYDTVFTAEQSTRLWDHLWENNNSFTKELVGAKDAHYINETYFINHIKYTLRYIDGHSGKTMWSMKYRWPSIFFGSKKQNPVLLIKKKFEKKFPYKLADN